MRPIRDIVLIKTCNASHSLRPLTTSLVFVIPITWTVYDNLFAIGTRKSLSTRSIMLILMGLPCIHSLYVQEVPGAEINVSGTGRRCTYLWTTTLIGANYNDDDDATPPCLVLPVCTLSRTGACDVVWAGGTRPLLVNKILSSSFAHVCTDAADAKTTDIVFQRGSKVPVT